jgi:SAM-dependent methyltransferase
MSQAGWKLEGGEVNLDDCRIEFIHDVLLEHLPKNGLIVDAGCGVARWPIYLRQRGYRVFGVEWSQEACNIAKAVDPGLEVMRGDVRATPLKDGSVDAVLSLGVVDTTSAGRSTRCASTAASSRRAASWCWPFRTTTPCAASSSTTCRAT